MGFSKHSIQQRALGACILVVAALSFAGSAEAATLSFAPAAGSPFAAGTGPRSVTSGDFDGDGDLDLATANNGSDDVSVLLGDGAGGFVAAPAVAAGTNPRSVTSGDFDGDGDLDLATANANSDDVSVLLGDGAGGFVAAPVVAVGSTPFSVTSGDFDGDGDLDLATANFSSSNVSVLLGDGAGGFVAAPAVAAGTAPISVTSGDFDGDGDLDLATANAGSNNVSVLLGDGAGGFVAAPAVAAGTTPLSVTSGDLDGDGDLDLATANEGSNNVSVLLGNGAGGFVAAPAVAAGTTPASVTSGDFDRDGDLDLATANQGSNNVSVLLGNGAGGFVAAPAVAAGTTARSVTSGDFDGDGDLDLATANNGSADVSVLLNTTDFDPADSLTPALNFTVGDGPSGITYADFNGDGDLDLATSNYAASSVSVLFGNGARGWGAKTDFTTGTGTGPVSIVSADFDGDGDPDLATGNQDANNMSVLLNTGSGAFGAPAPHTTGISPFAITSADFNTDGNPDLAIANQNSASVSVFFGNGSGGFGLKNDFTFGGSPTSVVSADFNTDGNPDLATANNGGGTVAVRLGNGAGGFASVTNLIAGTNPFRVTSADLNGDGNPDLAVANLNSANVSVFLGNGAGGFGLKTDFVVGASPFGITSADFNGDGSVDLAVANQGPNTVSLLLGNGAGGFGPKTDFAVGAGPFGITSADFDTDGKADVATPNITADNVSVLFGDIFPTAVNDTPTRAEDSGATTVDVLANDTDPDAGPKSIASATQPANGTVVVAGNNLSLSYEPDADYCNDPGAAPTDDFSYTLNGGSSATVAVTVTCANDDPVANFDARTVGEDSGATSLDVLTNDTDADAGDAIEVTAVTQPVNGTVSVVEGSPDEISYTPDDDYCNDPGAEPTDDFTYTITGGDIAAVEVTVTCAADNPVATDDTRTVGEDSGATSFDVLSNDTDADAGDAIEITAVTQPDDGTVSVVEGSPDEVSYTPDGDYCNDPGATPTDDFTYTVNGGDTATVAVTVTCAGDDPVANDDTRTVGEDSGATSFNVLTNDTDADVGDAIEITAVTQPTDGTVSVVEGSPDEVSYTPDADYCNDPGLAPTDDFTYTVTGGDTATVEVTVTCAADDPAAVDDTRTVGEDSGATSFNVLTNDTDAESDAIEITAVTQPDDGTATIVEGSPDEITYAPDTDYCNDPGAAPTDDFTYTVNGGDTATVAVTVTCAADDPVAFADSRTVGEDSGATSLNVLTNDTDADEGDAIEITAVTQPDDGTVSVVEGSPDEISYTPDADYCNDPGAAPTDDFTYTITGGDTATVAVTVTCANDDPAAVDDVRTVDEDTIATSFNVLSNDTDADPGDAIEITAVSNPANGTATVLQGSPDQIVYTPDADYCNDPGAAPTDDFTYTITGGDTASVAVTVTCTGDDPVAVNDARTVGEDSGATSFNVLSNDTDLENDTIEITAVTQPNNGTATVVQGSPDQISYTPDADYCNDPGAAPTDDFSYTISGGDTATVAVTVTCVDDDANAVNDARTVAADSGDTSFDVISNDTDSDGGSEQIASVTQPANGTVAITGAGANLTYRPAVGYCNSQPGGTADSFTYTLDGGSQATVTVTVTCAANPATPAKCAGLDATIEGSGRLRGTAGRDVIVGSSGRDIIESGGGDDVICAGDGADRVTGGAGNDRLFGGKGNDVLSGSTGRDRISGGSGKDRMLGRSGNDRLTGGSGNDRAHGGSGNDRVSGDSGNDSLSGDTGNDIVTGGSGRDSLWGREGNDRVLGADRSRDRVNCGSGRDRATTDRRDTRRNCEGRRN